MIIRNKIFKASLLETLGEEPDYKRAKGQHNDPFSLATSRYYATEIDRANTALKNLKATSSDRIKPAVSRDERRRMLGNLGARLEYYAWEYHCALAPGNHAVLPNPSEQDVATLMVDGPEILARHAITTITDQFIAYVTEIVQRVDADWDDIRAVFFPNWTLTRLVKLSFTGSDSHKGGKSVVILGIEATRGNFPRREKRTLKLVYKPSDLTLDYLLVGDTARVRAAVDGLPDPPGGSLLENVNALIRDDHMIADGFFDRPHPGLAVYPILPRNSGDITGAYGYIKFLTSLPAARVSPTQMRANRIGVPAGKRDWIASTHEEIIDYYRAFGWLCAIGLNFGVADAHNGNLIVHRKRPHLIDNEISFKWICDSISKTGLSDVMGSWGPWDPAGLSSDKCQLYFANATTNRIEATKGARAALCINRGLREAIALFRRDPTTSLRTWLTSPALASAVARYTPRLTRAFGEALRGIHLGPPMRGLVPNPPPLPEGTPLGLKPWYNGAESYHRPNFALVDAAHDWHDYLNCDYPVYYRVLNSRDLLNARGAPVVVTQPALAHDHPSVAANRARTIAGPHYFDHYPAVHLFDVDVSTLDAPAGTIVRLDTPNQLLSDLTASFAADPAAIVLTGEARATTETTGRQWRIIDAGRIFHIVRVQETDVVEVYEAGSAIAMAIRQYERLRTDAVFRAALLNSAQTFVRNTYPPDDPPPGAPTIYDGF